LSREVDWNATPLGPPDQWSATLRQATQLAMASGLPHTILWGPQYIQIYNDAYARLISAKHPFALGRPNLEIWPEVAHLNVPIYTRYQRGETVSLEPAPIPTGRGGGSKPDTFPISFAPIREPDGRVGGILVGMLETTQNVAFQAM